jgi:uncharacterized protein
LERINPMRNLFFAITCLCLSFTAFAKDIPQVTNRFVNDYAGALAPEDARQLEYKLKGYFDSTSTQIVIVLENSLDGDDLFTYSQRLAQTWGIGEKGKNNGLLIYAAISDRKLQIQVGYGLEGNIPDALTSRVRRNIMNPAFKEGNYAVGLDEATTVFMQAASGEFVNDRDEKPSKGIKPGLVTTFIIVIIIILIFSRGGGRGNRNRGGWGGPVFWGGTFGSGGFSSGSGGGGGGFGGFGGGSFGGGGSGGSW